MDLTITISNYGLTGLPLIKCHLNLILICLHALDFQVMFIFIAFMHFIPSVFVKDCFNLVVAQCRILENLTWLLLPMFFSFVHLDIFIEDMFLSFALLLYLEGSINPSL